VIERCEAQFCGIENGSLLFRADANSPICSLYPSACTEENVRLTLKPELEKKRSAMWEFAEPIAKETMLDETINDARTILA
jgi:hypothetical protein